MTAAYVKGDKLYGQVVDIKASDIIGLVVASVKVITDPAYTIQPDDEIIHIDATSNDVTVSLPDPTDLKTYIVQRIDGSVNNAVLDTVGAPLLNGAASWTFYQWDSLTVYTDLTDWFIR